VLLFLTEVRRLLPLRLQEHLTFVKWCRHLPTYLQATATTDFIIALQCFDTFDHRALGSLALTAIVADQYSTYLWQSVWQCRPIADWRRQASRLLSVMSHRYMGIVLISRYLVDIDYRHHIETLIRCRRSTSLCSRVNNTLINTSTLERSVPHHCRQLSVADVVTTGAAWIFTTKDISKFCRHFLTFNVSFFAIFCFA